MNARYTMERIAKKYGFSLIRSNRHLVFRDTTGRTVVTSLSPSDGYALKNAERQFQKALTTPKPIRPPHHPCPDTTPVRTTR